MPAAFLTERRPDLVKEFVRAISSAKRLEEIRLSSQILVLWRCPRCKTEWWETACDRLRQQPLCRNCRGSERQPPGPPPDGSLAALYPAVASEFLCCTRYPNATPEILYANSGLHADWQCGTCGNRWSATICNRTANNSGCQVCANRKRGDANRRRMSGQSASDVAPHLKREFVRWVDDSCTKTLDAVGHGSALRAMWRCRQCGREWQSPIFLRTSGSGCRCKPRAKRSASRFVSDDKVLSKRFIRNITSPTRSKECTPLKSRDLCEWKCNTCEHSWNSPAGGLHSSKWKCPRCAILWSRLPKPGRSLAERFPDLAREFVRNLTRPHRHPSTLLPASIDRCEWRCRDCKKVWTTTPSTRVSGKGCRRCKTHEATLVAAAKSKSTRLVDACGDAQSAFVENLSRPGHPVALLAGKSNDRCRWRCVACGKTFVRTVSHFSKSQTCSPCSASARGRKWRKAPAGMSLLELEPDIAATFVHNMTTPEATPAMVRRKSRDLCEWKCQCGRMFIAPVCVRTMTPDYGCSWCRQRGRSLLEMEIAELLHAATNSAVEVDAAIESGRRIERVDLYLPKLNLYLDLDPERWHSSSEAIQRDKRKAKAFAQLRVRYIRVRPLGLPKVGGEVISVDATSKDAVAWFRRIAEWLRRDGVRATELRQTSIEKHLRIARERWKDVNGSPPTVSVASQFPQTANEFVRNLARPGFGVEWLAPLSVDECLWRCSSCGREWTQRPSQRFQSKEDLPGCKACRSHNRRGSLALKQVSVSVAEGAPWLLDEVVEFVDAPRIAETLLGRPATIGDLSIGSGLRAKWRCHDCQHEWVAAIGERASGRGCNECAKLRRGATRRKARPGQSLQDLFPEVAETLLENLKHPADGPDVVRPGSNARCRWRCPKCGRTDWITSPAHRCVAKACRRCRQSRAAR